MNYPEELRAVAKWVIWFEEPEEALKYPKRFLTYLMTYGTEAALDDPVPGIFDVHSWRQWNLRYHRVPVPPLPKRVFPGERPTELRGSLFGPKS